MLILYYYRHILLQLQATYPYFHYLRLANLYTVIIGHKHKL